MEIDDGDAGVVLQCFRQSLSHVQNHMKRKCILSKLGLDTKISDCIVAEIDGGNASVVLQHLCQSLQQQLELEMLLDRESSASTSAWP